MLVITAYCALFAMSCQKQLSSVDISNGGDTTLSPNTGNLLGKMISVSNTRYTNASLSNTNYTDSEVIIFSYDAQNRLVGETQNSYTYDSASNTAGSSTYFNTFIRDGLGRVTRFYYGGRNGGTGMVDSFYTDYYYVSSTSPLVAYEKPGGADSNAYRRNAAGQVERIDDYSYSNGNFTLGGYQVFLYDANNNTTKINVYGFSDENGLHTDSLAFTYTYQYDNYVNPLYTGDDIMPQWIWVDPKKMHNNATVYMQENNALEAGGSKLITTDSRTYTYRPDGKPLGCAESIYVTPDVGPHTLTKTTYFYK